VRKPRRLLLWCLVVLFVLTLSYLSLLAYPEPFFSCSATFSDVTFYSHSPVPPQAAVIASAVKERLATSELFAPGLRQRVFIVDQAWLWTFLNGPYRGAMARNVELGNAILVPRLDIARGLIRHFDGRCARAVPILTHEAVHTLIERRLGFLRTLRLQWWQREGYPEYIASGSALGGSDSPIKYRQAARIWKDLIERQHLTFDEVTQIKR
jgi:hypothetical protein